MTLGLCLAACSGSDKVAGNAVVPDLNTTSETPGDWSALAQAVDRTPADSGLLKQSQITVDLDSLLGARVQQFRLTLSDGTPLRREGEVLVTVSQSGQAYLIIAPADHALAAGLKSGGQWQRFVTPGAEVPVPPSVQRLLAGG